MGCAGAESVHMIVTADELMFAIGDPTMRVMDHTSPARERIRPTATHPHEHARWASRLVRTLLHRLGDPALCLRLWTGETIGPPPDESVATLSIADRAALLHLVADPDMQFGEMYMQGRITVYEGDLVDALEQTYLQRTPGASSVLSHVLRRGRRNTLKGSRQNIREHYDLGNDFYRLWLDPTLSYTCAYFPTAATTLEEAQVAKLDHVCRKLLLRAGDEVIEAGCGWGALALHAAKRYGARVRAFNISHEQIVYAREQARRAGLDARVEFIEDDYRNATGSCNAFMSVGMLEHVGIEHYPELGRVISRVLRPDGCGLIHSIGRNAPQPVNRWIERRIFPGTAVPSLSQMMQIFEPAGLSVLDVENLRMHYARTLAAWRAAFQQQRERIEDMFDAAFARMWELYLCGSQAAFQSGDMQLFQTVFAPPRSRRTPWTREHQYLQWAGAGP